MATARAPDAIAADEARHKYVLTGWVGIPEADWEASLIYLALRERGVTDIYDYSSLSKEDIEALDAPPETGQPDRRPVPFLHK